MVVDAVYLACKNFGARKFASYFTNDEIIEAIHFCHLYGVKIYVTMNNLVKNSEVDSFLEQVSFLHQHGVDALIIQDFERPAFQEMMDDIRNKHINCIIVKDVLLNTKDYIIAENCIDEDTDWGLDSNNQGDNNLGKIWMKIRDD